MVQIANISGVAQHFTETAGGLVSIAPGTAAPVEIDRESPQIVAKLRAKLIEVGGTSAKAAKVAREKAPTEPTE
ncbi:hypothetical protein [Aureimonas mangrovi]|uniref:hypothetical protein n=1 Tax=Aureimonas mangrovi TaxID=2758041 RepID=UPI00163D6744|nr:hypothetical protein [Aureimonas mangrovi]